MATVTRHTELIVWQLCNELEESLAPLLRSAAFSREPDLQDQMIRASQRPCPNIAEGFGRYYPRDNARFVRVARGSLDELLDHLARAKARGVLAKPDAERLIRLANRAAGAATKYLVYLESAKSPLPPGQRSRRKRPNNGPSKNPPTRNPSTRNPSTRNPKPPTRNDGDGF